jgi:uncharacterized membrane protein
MRNKESIKELLNYLQDIADRKLKIDDEAIAKAYQKNNDHQSLVIKILSIFGGILASLAFLGFLLIAGLYDSGVGQVIFSILFLAGAVLINKAFDKIIVDTVSVSSFIIGFTLLGLGLEKLEVTVNTICIVCILVSLLYLIIAQSYILSFVAILVVNGSILTVIISNNQYDLVHIYVALIALAVTYFFLAEAKIITTSKALSKLYNPLRIGLIFSFLSGLIILGKKEILPISADYIWWSSIVIIAAILYTLSKLFVVLAINKMPQKVSIFMISGLLLLPTLFSPAISGAILIILLSFFINYKTGLIVGIIAFIYFISQYYYDLSFTLLTKSIILFSSGILFIALYLFIHKKLISNEKI